MLSFMFYLTKGSGLQWTLLLAFSQHGNLHVLGHGIDCLIGGDILILESISRGTDLSKHLSDAVPRKMLEKLQDTIQSPSFVLLLLNFFFFFF